MQTLTDVHPDAGKPWYTQRWPWLLMLGPALVVVAGFVTAWLAFSRQDALVVDDYYKQGKAINQDLRRDRMAESLGMSAQLRYDAAAGRLSGKIFSHGQAKTGKLSISLVHSTQPARDLVLEAQADGNGDFSIALPMLDIARWQVRIEGEQSDWRLHGTWTWPQQPQIDIQATTELVG